MFTLQRHCILTLENTWTSKDTRASHTCHVKKRPSIQSKKDLEQERYSKDTSRDTRSSHTCHVSRTVSMLAHRLFLDHCQTFSKKKSECSSVFRALTLYSGFTRALIGLYKGFTRALLGLYSGFDRALLGVVWYF